jgi:parvulin-like peptidyl-prolyl isomerase
MGRRKRSEMKYFSLVLKTILAVSLLAVTTGFASDQKLPILAGKRVVATVNGDPITLDEFNRELMALHRGVTEEKKVGRENSLELLKRLVNTKLIIQEAGRIGLDQLPEVKNMVDVFSRVTLRELLAERHVRNIKADEKEVDRIYKELVKEWKIKSVIIEKEDSAKKMEEEIKAGKNFNEIASKVVAEGMAKGGEEGNFLRRQDLLPQVAGAVTKMEAGSISPIIPVESGFVILKVEEIRYPESQMAKEQAKQEALNLKREKALRDYNDALIKRYVKIDKKILDAIDYEAKEPGFQKFLEDKRVIAEITGEKAITIGELTDYLRQQFYHGIERAIESKKLNERKESTLEEMLYKRVFRKEALRLGIDKTESYKNKVKEYENSVIFGTFVQKVIIPDVKLKEEEVKTYYDEHIKEYTFPEMMKIKSLAFAKRGDAEAATEKLRKGTDFQWLSANVEGQVDKNTKGLLTFEGKLITIKSLPEGVQRAISRAKSGDFRLYESSDGYFYVLAIQEVVPPKPQPFEDTKKIIAKIIFNNKLKKVVEDWAEKLRGLSEVKIYLKD